MKTIEEVTAFLNDEIKKNNDLYFKNYFRMLDCSTEEEKEEFDRLRLGYLCKNITLTKVLNYIKSNL